MRQDFLLQIVQHERAQMTRVGDDEIVQLAQGIWHSMLKLPLMPIERPDISECLSACVQISGEWTGAVRIDCSEGAARRIAAAFFGLSADEVAREQMVDALGEVANMIAGSLKPLLPNPCHISLPSVVNGPNDELNIREWQLMHACKFDLNGGSVKISVLEATGRPQAGTISTGS